MTDRSFLRLVRVLVVALLVLGASACLLPAAGQTPLPVTPVTASLRVDIADPARAFIPGAYEQLPISITYSVGNGAQAEPDPDNPRTLARPTRFTFEIMSKPSWLADASIVPSEAFADPQGGRDVAVADVFFIFNVSPDAPALQREELIVIVNAEANGNIEAQTKASAPIKLRAAEVAKLNVTSPGGSSVVIEGGKWVVVPFVVRNDGNDAVVAVLNVTIRPELSEIELPVKQVDIPRNGSVTIDVRVRTPWNERETGTLELEATPLLDDEEGTPTKLAIDLSATSAVPAPSFAILLLCSAMSAILMRKRVRVA